MVSGADPGLVQQDSPRPPSVATNASNDDSSDHSGIQTPTSSIGDWTSSALVSARSDTGSAVRLAWRGLTIDSVVQDAAGALKQGEMLALMSSDESSAVLLAVLAGRQQGRHVTGEFLVDGGKCTPLNLNRRLASSYVASDFTLVGEMTVRQTFMFSARLSHSSGRSVAKQRVDEMIEKLGLGHVADNVIGTVVKRSLSGGEKRRVEVGAALLRDPAVLFCDEPTSGLDSYAALLVVEELRKACYRGVTVVTRVMQPSPEILAMMDAVYIMDKGRTVYHGPVPMLRSYLEHLVPVPVPPSIMPLEFFLFVLDDNVQLHPTRVHKMVGKQTSISPVLDILNESKLSAKRVNFAEEFRRSELAARQASIYEQSTKTNKKSRLKRERASFCTQFDCLLRRNLSIAYRDPTLYWFVGVLIVAFGLTGGVLFLNLPFVIDRRVRDGVEGLTWIIYVGLLVHVFKIYHSIRAITMFHHEHANNVYHVLPWYLADQVVILLLTLPVQLPGCFLTYVMQGWKIEEPFYMAVIIYFMGITSEALCTLCCHIFSVPGKAMILAQGSLIALSLYSGTAVPWADVKAEWMWLLDLSPFTHASRGAILATFPHVTYTCPTAQVQPLATGGALCIGPTFERYVCQRYSVSDGSCSVGGMEVIRVQLAMPEDEWGGKWHQVLYLALIMMALRLLAFVFLIFPPWAIVQHVTKRVRSCWVPKSASAGRESLSATTTPDRNPTIEVLSQKEKVQDQETWRQDKDMQSGVEMESLQSSAFPELGASASAMVWENIRVTLRNGKVLAHDISGVALAGRVMALMGQSGSGKTTLLNALTERASYARVQGSKSFNHLDLSKIHLEFVQQHTRLNGCFTVLETFQGIARLKVKGPAAELIQELLAVMGLQPYVDTPVGKLDSGLHKRIAVGLALLARPQVLCLDEPTTGLDSSAALSVFAYLQKTARQYNVVVVATVHQPSSLVFQLCDDLLLLSSGGHMAFQGPRRSAVEYFTKLGYNPPPDSNPADFYLSLIFKPPVPAMPAEGQQEDKLPAMSPVPAEPLRRLLPADKPRTSDSLVMERDSLVMESEVHKPQEFEAAAAAGPSAQIGNLVHQDRMVLPDEVGNEVLVQEITPGYGPGKPGGESGRAEAAMTETGETSPEAASPIASPIASPGLLARHVEPAALSPAQEQEEQPEQQSEQKQQQYVAIGALTSPWAADQLQDLEAVYPPCSPKDAQYRDKDKPHWLWAALFLQRSPFQEYMAKTANFYQQNRSMYYQQEASPGALRRFLALCRTEMQYSLRNSGRYWLVILLFLVLGLYTASNFGVLRHELTELDAWVAVGIYSMECAYIGPCLSIAEMIHDRRIRQEQYLNNSFSLLNATLAQCLCGLPFSLLGALAFHTPVALLCEVTTTWETFLFQVLVFLLYVHFMEGVLLVLCEITLEPMLATSAGMVVWGCLFGINGLVVEELDMPHFAEPVAYLLPTRYLLSASMNNMVAPITYTGHAPDGSVVFVPGADLLQQVLGESPGYNKWEGVLAGAGFTLGLRCLHFALMWYRWSFKVKA
eukprot:g19793.t1